MTGNVEQVEETVHYAMAQRPSARRVLLIGGGVCGTAKEILKYPVQAVDYVELDPLIVRAARQFLPGVLADPRIEVVPTDGRLFVRQSPHRYDVVIADVPDFRLRIHPARKLTHLPPTPTDILVAARDLARRAGLHYVYIGNIRGVEGAETTVCPHCRKAVAQRDAFFVSANQIQAGVCSSCGTKIAGVWSP